jgi:acyl-CoA thioesterase
VGRRRASLSDTPFATDTAVEPDDRGPGAYRAEVTERWRAPVLPHGGMVTAIALNAMAAELSIPEHRLRSVTTVFAGQVLEGPVDVDVTVLRRGRSMSQLLATVRSAGAPAGHTTLAVFGDSRRGFEFTELPPPAIPPVAECPSYDDLPDGFSWPEHATFFDQVETRLASGHFPWDDYEPTTSENTGWLRFRQAPFLDTGALDPRALVVLCDTMPGAVGERIGRQTETVWYGPSADLTVHLLGETTAEWLFWVNRARHAGGGYASVEMELWDPTPALVAYATQVMFFSFPEGR